jgi:hypothetical protein
MTGDLYEELMGKEKSMVIPRSLEKSTICRCEAVFAEAISTKRAKLINLEIASSHRTLLAKTFPWPWNSHEEKSARTSIIYST